MSELSFVQEDEGLEWSTIIGIVVLLLTIVGCSFVGVAANIVYASSGFVIQAQRSGFVLFVSAVPAFFEYYYYPGSVDWDELLLQSNIIYSLLTTTF